MSTPFKGQRVWPNADGYLNAIEMQKPGAYGKVASPLFKDNSPLKWWQITAPNGAQGSLNPDIHTVTEHEDGTISVHPSLDFNNGSRQTWHGWLKQGIFTTV